jgi:hypothetical protein
MNKAMKPSDAQWSPWNDPDAPEKPMSEVEREQFRKGVAVLLKKLRKQPPQAPAPLSEARRVRAGLEPRTVSTIASPGYRGSAVVNRHAAILMGSAVSILLIVIVAIVHVWRR